MHRYFFLAIWLLLFYSWPVNAQNPAPIAPEPVVLLATYQLVYQPDSTAPDKRAEKMQLTVGKTVSKFESLGQMQLDTLRAHARQQPTTPATVQQAGKQMTSMSFSNFKYTIYKQPTARRVYYDERIMRETYRYEEPASLYTWTILPATATVAGYKCQKATCAFGGRQFEAWFAREIPVADGPYKFYGLPGLIVQVADTRRHYVFELLEVSRPAQQLVGLPSPTDEPVTLTTKARLRQAKRDYDLTLADKIAAMGHAVSEADRREYQLKLKKKNNPLEVR